MSHRYSYFSWWWAHRLLKHVEKTNIHTKKSCAPSWLLFTRLYGNRSANLPTKWHPFSNTPLFSPTFVHLWTLDMCVYQIAFVCLEVSKYRCYSSCYWVTIACKLDSCLWGGRSNFDYGNKWRLHLCRQVRLGSGLY